jgi:hypothetical protein
MSGGIRPELPNTVAFRPPPPERPRRLLALVLAFLVGAAAGAGALRLWDRPPKLPPRRLEATVYLPTKGNPDKPFTQQDWDEAVGLLAEEFGGATLGPEVEGCWRDRDNRLMREPVRLVVVSFEPHRLDDFRRALKRVGRLLRQEEMYTRFEQPLVELQAINP